MFSSEDSDNCHTFLIRKTATGFCEYSRKLRKEASSMFLKQTGCRTHWYPKVTGNLVLCPLLSDVNCGSMVVLREPAARWAPPLWLSWTPPGKPLASAPNGAHAESSLYLLLLRHCDPTADISNLKEEGFLLLVVSKVSVHHGRRAWQPGSGGRGYRARCSAQGHAWWSVSCN